MRESLTAIDATIIVLYLLAVLGVGVYYAFGNKSSEDFLLGGRRMLSWSIDLSLLATVLSTISFLAWSGEIIRFGPAILIQVIVYPTAFVIVGFFLIPLIMRQPVTIAYEILETRLGPSVCYLSSTIILVLRLLWMSVVMYATVEKIMIPVLHLPEWSGPLVCVVIGGIAVVYTSLGGLNAVVAIDVVQATILLSAALATLVLVSYRLGGIEGWWPKTWPEHWSEPRLWFHSHNRSVFGFLLTMVTWYVAMAGSDQMAIQRNLATRDVRATRKALGIAWGVEACAFCLMAMIGLALLAWFTMQPDWLQPGESISETPDRLFPRFIVNGLPVGITGLVVAAITGAAMASLMTGSLFVVFVVAFFVSRATSLVAWIAAIVAKSVAVTISFFPQHHGLGFLWITPASLFSGALAGFIAAAFIGRPQLPVTSTVQGDAIVGKVRTKCGMY